MYGGNIYDDSVYDGNVYDDSVYVGSVYGGGVYVLLCVCALFDGGWVCV